MLFICHALGTFYKYTLVFYGKHKLVLGGLLLFIVSLTELLLAFRVCSERPFAISRTRPHTAW